MDLTDRDKKLLIGMGIVVGVLVVFFGAKALLGGGDELEPVTAAAPADGVTPPDATSPGATTASPSPSVAAVPPAAEGPVLSGRDFFSPLPVPSPSATLGVSPSPTSGGGGNPNTVDDTEVIDGNTVTLEDLVEKKKGDEVDVSVNGKNFTGLGVGDTFDGDYTVNGIDGDNGCADFQFDKKGSGQSFKLCL